MASDHRGRDLHAGKRTAQEMGWRALPYEDDDGEVRQDMYTKGSFGNHLIVTPSETSKGYTWSTKAEIPKNVGLPADLGRSKGAMIYDRPDYPDANILAVGGKTRTPKRAMIAAEAMQNRIKEGRDLKTGRPKK